MEKSLAAERCSLPVLTGRKGPAAEKAAQRFLSNDKVELEALRTGLYKTTWELAKTCEFIVVAYDPTLLDYSTHNQKLDRIKIGDGKGMGYVALNSAAIDPHSGRFLGVVYQSLVSVNGPDDTALCDYELGATHVDLIDKLKFNPKQQFIAHALCVHQRAPADRVIVFVADREFDDGLALRRLINLPHRHVVIRGNNTRAVQVEPAPWIPTGRKIPSKNTCLKPTQDGLLDIYVRDLCNALPLQPCRILPIDARGRVCDDDKHAVHRAQLSLGGVRIRLGRNSKRALKAGIEEEPIWLNQVVIRETNPRPGKKPLEWILLTDLPISTLEEMQRVVDIYACRWRIEEFFRTCKDVLKVEDSELDDATATARLWFFVTVKAMVLDMLRQAAGVRAGRPPTRDQRLALMAGEKRAMEIERARREKGRPPPRLTDAQRAIMTLGHLARLGGWAAKNNAHLGNEVLTRGVSGVSP